MKKTIFYPLFMFVMFFMSCKKEDIKPDSAYNSDLLNEVEKLETNSAAQKLAFKDLTPNEKYQLWKNQIEYYKLQKFNSEQIHQLDILLDFLNPEIFTIGYDKSKLARFEIQFVPQALKSFNKLVLFKIMTEIHSNEYVTNFTQSISSNQLLNNNDNVIKSFTLGTPPKLPACYCAMNSPIDYCSSGLVNYYACSISTCSDPSTYGCGLFFAWSCNGLCREGGA